MLPPSSPDPFREDMRVAPQHWDPDTYATHARFVADFGLDVLALLAPEPGERVLDLGCGDGALTERLVSAGCSVVGVDSSSAQVTAARARGLDARVGRGESLSFEGEFDAVFSNARLTAEIGGLAVAPAPVSYLGDLLATFSLTDAVKQMYMP